jgi:hypothetical protein
MWSRWKFNSSLRINPHSAVHTFLPLVYCTRTVQTCTNPNINDASNSIGVLRSLRLTHCVESNELCWHVRSAVKSLTSMQSCEPLATAAEPEAVQSEPIAWAVGPHSRSNWVIPGRLCVGGWPYRLPTGRGCLKESRADGEAKLRSLVDAGVTVFCNLTDAEGCDAVLRVKEYGAGRYEAYVRSIICRPAKPTFLRCPMPDGGCTDDCSLATLLRSMLALSPSTVQYVHCYGGHGRAGLVVCAILGIIEGLSVDGAIARFNELHRYRAEPTGGGQPTFPHSDAQREQLQRVLDRSDKFAEFGGST